MSAQENTPLPVLNALWVEGALSYAEQVCLASAVSTGHRTVLYTYFDVTGVPGGVELRDGREVLSEDRLIKHKALNSYALFSDLFRYRIMELGLGYWIDCDAYIWRPLALDRDHVFAHHDPDTVNVGVLYLAPGSPVLRSILRFLSAPAIVPPWWRSDERWRQRLRGLLGRATPASELQWGSIGPRLVTHFARRHGLMDQALPRKVFYPVNFDDAAYLFDPRVDIERFISPDTLSIHFWNTGIRSLKRWPAPPGSFMHTLCLRHDVDPNAVDA